MISIHFLIQRMPQQKQQSLLTSIDCEGKELCKVEDVLISKVNEFEI